MADDVDNEARYVKLRLENCEASPRQIGKVLALAGQLLGDGAQIIVEIDDGEDREDVVRARMFYADWLGTVSENGEALKAETTTVANFLADESEIPKPEANMAK